MKATTSASTMMVLALASVTPGSLAFVRPTSIAGSHQQHRPIQTRNPRAQRATTTTTTMTISSEDESLQPVSRRSLLEGFSKTFAAASSVAALALNHPAPAAAKPQRIKGGGPVVTLNDGAQYQEMTIGDGPSPHDGDRVAVHYSLFYNGLEVESSRDSQGLAAQPLGYTCGTVAGPGSVVRGLDECIRGMQVGGRRKLTLPPELAFGTAGRPPFIPGGATVQMDVSLWSVKAAGTDPNVTLPGSSVF